MNTGSRSGVRLSRLVPLAGLLFCASPCAEALANTQLYLDGQFRARARRYENLLTALTDGSLSGEESSTASQNSLFYFQQRLRLEPELRVNEYVSVFSEIDVLPHLTWGSNPERLGDVDGYYLPMGQGQSFSVGDAASLIVPRRAWAELYTPIGRIKIGRTGMQVGSGIFFNDGLGPDADYGDTADRIQFLGRVGPVFLLVGYDRTYEGLADQGYDGNAFAAAVAYRSELLTSSLYSYLQSDRTAVNEATAATTEDLLRNEMLIWNVDLWAKTSLGPVDLELEALYRYGQGDMVLESTTDGIDPETLEGASLSQFGGMARATYRQGPFWSFGLETGLATGDADEPVSQTGATGESRLTLNRFVFDRDYHIGLLMFREAYPVGASGSSISGYTTDKFGAGISNAFYLRPSVQLQVLDNLSARVFGVGAWAMQTNSFYNAEKDYGYELDLEINSTLFDRVTLAAQGALLLPGLTFAPNNSLAFGGELRAVIDF